jgi:hypothetical protein
MLTRPTTRVDSFFLRIHWSCGSLNGDRNALSIVSFQQVASVGVGTARHSMESTVPSSAYELQRRFQTGSWTASILSGDRLMSWKIDSLT